MRGIRKVGKANKKKNTYKLDLPLPLPRNAWSDLMVLSDLRAPKRRKKFFLFIKVHFIYKLYNCAFSNMHFPFPYNGKKINKDSHFVHRLV